MARTALAVAGADFHLDRPDKGAWRRRPELYGDSCYALTQIVDLCVERHLPLLAAGDLLDESEQDDGSAVQHAIHQIDRLSKETLPFYFNQGQHDMVQTRPWLELHPWAQHVHKKVFKLGPWQCYGLDWTPKDELKVAFSSIPVNIDLTMMHQVWINFMGQHIGGECAFIDVPHTKVLLTGDFHRRMNMQALGATRQTIIVLSPGSTCMRSIDEEPEKSVFVLYDDFTTETVPLKSRFVYRRRLKTKEDLDNFLEELPQLEEPTPDRPDEIARPILHIIHDPDIPDAYRKLSAATADKFHLFLSPKTFSIYGPEPAGAPLAGPVALEMNFDKILERKLAKDSPEYILASRLLASEAPSKVLDELTADFFKNSPKAV
jgi:hypothetical protein